MAGEQAGVQNFAIPEQQQVQPEPVAAPQPTAPTTPEQQDILPPITMGENMENLPVAPAVEEAGDYDKIFDDSKPEPIQPEPAPVQQQPQVQQEPQGPVDLLAQLPLLSGPARIINGDTLSIRGRNVILFGIDAPELSQTCTNQRGQSYNCGKEAALWLKDWLGNHEIQCRIMKEDSRGNLLGVCMAGEYDIAAALVNTGLAFANTKMSEIYVPYQEQARANARGLWAGKFYMPWDWRRMQSQKANIKVIKRTKKKKGILDF